MKIDTIYISCYRYDVELTRLCVASIRYWYPDVPIWLLKDRRYGDFSTHEIEKAWNAGVFRSRLPNLGWGFGKLEVLCLPQPSRCLCIDSDIVFAGRVLDLLETYDEDFIVAEENYSPAEVEEQFFSPLELAKLDPEFRYPGTGFNGGQIVAATGKVRREDFEPFLDWQRVEARRPDIFKKGDQGLTNYVLLKKAMSGQVTMRRVPFMVLPGDEAEVGHIRLSDLTPEGRHQQLIHWAGLRWGKSIEQMPRSDILVHFEDLYYSRVRFGSWFRRWRRAKPRLQRGVLEPAKRVLKRFLRPKRATLAPAAVR